MFMLPIPPTPELIQKSLGIPLSQIPEDKLDSVIEDLTNVFYEFIFEYIEIEYSRADSIKLKTAHKNNLDIFSKFPDLQNKYQQATKAYFDMLKGEGEFAE